MNLLQAVELTLEGKLTGEGLLESAIPPNRYRSFTFVMVAEVKKADEILNLFNRHAVDQFDFSLRTDVDVLQRAGKAATIFSIPRWSSILGEINTHPCE